MLSNASGGETSHISYNSSQVLEYYYTESQRAWWFSMRTETVTVHVCCENPSLTEEKKKQVLQRKSWFIQSENLLLLYFFFFFFFFLINRVSLLSVHLAKDQPFVLCIMILYWFYFSGYIKKDYKNKYFVTEDWSLSRNWPVIPTPRPLFAVH